jgi:tRNA pseudouridine38-40 synthase
MRYKAVVSYDGSDFFGFQRQSNLISVQGEIEKALLAVFQQDIKVISAGRTDAMVHAIGQVIHFDSDIVIPLENLRGICNKHLMPHIYIKSMEYADEAFHARISAKAKEYHYLVSLGEFDPLKSRYIAFWPKNIDLQAIEMAITYFCGKHDFRTFTKNKEIRNSEREIFDFHMEKKEDLLTFVIIGNGFMHNMVRIMMGALKRVGLRKMAPEAVSGLLEAKNRRLVPYTENPSGLYLYKVFY